jgi:hypothetical protein
MLQLKLLPGAMLLMLASTLSINPVSAQTDPASGTGGMQNQMDMNTPQTPSRTNTQPVQTPMQRDTMQMEQSTPSSTETTTNTVSGTIKSIEGEVVTIEMADGMTKQMRVSTADSQRLNLREGMQISATVDGQSMASNITLAQASTTTGTEATSSQVGTTSTSTEATTSTITTEADVSSDTPTTTTTENTRTTVQSTPANRPVRALW